jgi:hypothetical protein
MNASLDKPVDWLEEQDRWARSQVAFAKRCSDCCFLRLWHLSPVGTAYLPACLKAGACEERATTDLHRPAAEDSISLICSQEGQTGVHVKVKVNEESTLWQMLDLVLAQFDGIVAGYEARHEAEPEEIPPLSRRDLIFLNGNGMSSSSPLIASSRKGASSGSSCRHGRIFQNFSPLHLTILFLGVPSCSYCRALA